MRPTLRPSSYANVTSTLALIVALGGVSAYAANAIGSRDIRDNSVRSADIRNDTVATVDIRNGTLAAVDVKNGGLLAEDFKEGQLPAAYASQAPTPPAANPLPVARASSQPATLILPAAGRVLVYGHSRVSAQCVPGQSLRVGLYLDGEPVPGTGRTIAHTATAELDVTGLSAHVEAGAHTLAQGVACTGGDFPTGTTTTELVLGGILTGS